MSARRCRKQCARKGCRKPLQGAQLKWCSQSCKLAAYRDQGKCVDPRTGERQRYRRGQKRAAVLEPPVHGAGQLMRGGNPGNRGGKGRLPNVIRNGMRELTWTVLEETIRRVELSSRLGLAGVRFDEPSLRKMSKDELIKLLLDIYRNVQLDLAPNELRQILDTAAKYGIGSKHVHSGDEDDTPLPTGIVIMPALASDLPS